MSQILTLEVSEQTFIAIQQQAKPMGISPERLATTLLEQQLTQNFGLFLNETEKEAARVKFERHFGEMKIEPLVSLDNEIIDSDLAEEYANPHEFE